MNPLDLKLSKLKNFEFKAEYLLSYEVISFGQSDQGVIWFSLHNNNKIIISFFDGKLLIAVYEN